MVVIVMGVAGSGKTTIGERLAAELGWQFADADTFHSAANRAKMAAGQPLDDTDRAPWLASLRTQIDRWLELNLDAVLACSALKESCRQRLVGDRASVRVVFLHGDRELIRSRLQGRTGHFMAPAMLDSQLATLEPPAGSPAFDIAARPAELVAQIRRSLNV